MPKFTRRDLLLTGGVTTLTSPLTEIMSGSVYAQEKPTKKPFRSCLNFGTLIGFNLSFEEEIDVAAKAGFRSIEPWPSKIEQFLEKGGKLSDARKRINDHGLIVENLCTFYPWMVDDDSMRTNGIEQMKNNMDWAVQLGTDRIAATSIGATEVRLDDFRVLGDRYRTLLEIGDTIGVWPLLEIWGRVKTLNSLADCLAVAAWAGHPQAMLLLDVFHLYRGGSPIEGLSLVNGKKIHTFHVHDYPADPPRDKIEDNHRVYCGDGVAPLTTIFRTLRSIGFEGSLSFEVFNQTYWATNDPLLVVKTGLEKLESVISASEL